MSDKAAGKILVVDDNAFVLETTTLFLKSQGFETTALTDPEEAARRAGEEPYDAVISDVKMPKVTGIELLEAIHARRPELPVILMTAYAELDLAIEAVKKGAFDFIIKPYKPEYLSHSVKKAVNYHRLLEMEKNYKWRLEEEVRKRTKDLSDALSTVSSLTRELSERLTTVAEFRDVETGAHIKRLGHYAEEMSAVLGMPRDFVEMISITASLHDIGKIGIPDSILLKPGALTPEEFRVMKTHTTIGWKMLAGSSHPFVKFAASIALNHHERWDGGGYPGGLKGADIPMEGRIIIICDQYDALRSKRPYKDPLTHREAMRIITEGDGRTLPSHFDPDVLRAFAVSAATLEEIYETHKD